jgi:hypothetical protein
MTPAFIQPWLIGLLSASVVVGLLTPAWADADDSLARAAVAGEVAHKQKMHQLFPDPVSGVSRPNGCSTSSQSTPAGISILR